jgi:hypothetical protein
MYPDGKQVFQQDGAPAHTLISMQQFVESNMSCTDQRQFGCCICQA